MVLLQVVALAAAAFPLTDLVQSYPHDVFGRPRPHGEPVAGISAGLYMGRTNLHYGQPWGIEFFTWSVPPEGPRLIPVLDDPPNARLELTDADGRPIPYRLESEGYTLGRGVRAQRLHYRLWPTPAHAVGPHWRPGTYHLRGVIDNKPRPEWQQPPGTFRTNSLTLTVAKPGTPLETLAPTGTIRDRVAGLVRAFEAPTADDREAAAKSLVRDFDPWVIPLLEAARDAASPDADRLLMQAIESHEAVLRRWSKAGLWEDQHDYWLWVAGLDEHSSEWLRRWKGIDVSRWRTAAAHFAPITIPQDRPLRRSEVGELIRGLRSIDPWERALAIRSVPRAAPREVRIALAEKLYDEYYFTTPGPDPVPYSPIRRLALVEIARLGREMVGPLIGVARQSDERILILGVAESLGRIGHDPDAEAFLRSLVRDREVHDELQQAAVFAACQWERAGLPVFREAAACPELYWAARRQAAAELALYGTAEADGPTLRDLLAVESEELRAEAAAALATLRDVKSVPDLERMARDDQVGVKAQLAALDAAHTLTDRDRGDRLLLEVAKGSYGKVQYGTLERIGRRRVTAGLPLLLGSLDDPDPAARVAADKGLRAFANLPKGVGYDPENPDPARWREAIKSKQK